jgi:hypothetical protein
VPARFLKEAFDMSNFEIFLGFLCSILAVFILIRFWFVVVTGIALWFAYDLFRSDGMSANYWPIFWCWFVSFGVLSNLLGVAVLPLNTWRRPRTEKLTEAHR